MRVGLRPPHPVGQATTRAVGSSFATSLAKVGPEMTATLGLCAARARTVSAKSDIRSNVPFSSPLVALMKMVEGAVIGAKRSLDSSDELGGNCGYDDLRAIQRKPDP